MEQHIFKKKYGQNFLNDQNILEKISKSVTPTEKDLIIEIGPGSGNLTKWLQKYNCNIICYEIDESLKSTLSLLENPKTKIIYKDILSANIKEDIKDINYENLYVIANIPYYITTPIIEKLTFSNLNPKAIILMMQKELGERLTSKPHSRSYGYITALLNYFYDIKILFNVSKKCFYPVPKVDSVVVRFNPIERPKTNIDKLNKFLKDSFQFKRKNLRNNLKNYDLNKVDIILKKNGYSLANRAEDIPIEVYIDIIDNL